MISFLTALVMGGIIGWLASIVMRRDAAMGVVANIIIGCVGSILGGSLFSVFTGGTANLRNAPFAPLTLLVAFGGAVILLGIINYFKRGSIR